MHETMKRLYQAAEEKKEIAGTGRQSAVARLLNTSPQNVKNWETRGISKNGMIDAARAFGISAVWLETGEGMMSAFIPPSSIVADASDYRPELDTHWPIDMYDIKLSAGTGNGEWIIREDEPLYFRQAWFKARRLSRADLRGMYVRGDSMEPVLKNWDTVIIDTADTEPTDGEIYAVVYKDKFYIKTVRNVADGIDLISYNPDYPPIEVREADRFQCLGRMVWRGG